MKKIVTTILSITALLASTITAFGQNTQEQVIADEYHDNGSGLVYSKIAQGPNEYGEYTIYLKSYVKGTVTHTDKVIPTDIVLVLDVSGSMADPMKYEEVIGTWSYDDINYSSTTYYYKSGNNYYQVTAYYYDRRYRLYYYTGDNYREIGTGQRENDQTIYDGALYTKGNTTRMKALQDGVATFIKQIKDDADEKGVDNRIAIVKFASNEDNTDHSPNQANPQSLTGINPKTNSANWRYYDYGDGTYYNYTQIVADFTDVRTGDGTLTGYVNSFTAAGATSSDYGMKRAKWLLQRWAAVHPARVSNKIVVMFTDGEPNHGSGFVTSVADGAIREAKTIKAMIAYEDPETHKTANAKVYTIGTFSEMSDDIKNYMNYVSSNYPDASSLTDSGDGSETNGFFFNVTNPDDLKLVFKTIGTDAASPVINIGSSSTVVDVVSKSFILPAGSDHNSVEVYTTPPDGVDATGNLTFSIDKSKWSRITSSAGLTSDPSTGEVKVTNFDFAENACAAVIDGNDRVFLGRELILEIPIMMDKDAVGGHGVQTNASGSGITYTEDGETKFFDFEQSPDINLPINLHIEKQGLGDGESARFTIQRKWLGPGNPPEGIDSNTWYNYTTVFVTGGKETKDRDGIVDENPTVRIVGLHPDYVYRIKEEGWSWSYNLSSVSGLYLDPSTGQISTVTLDNGTAADWSDNTVTSDRVNQNPITFVNSQSDGDLGIKIRHAESIVVNDFRKTGSGQTIDSKTQPTN